MILSDMFCVKMNHCFNSALPWSIVKGLWEGGSGGNEICRTIITVGFQGSSTIKFILTMMQALKKSIQIIPVLANQRLSKVRNHKKSIFFL